jgi:hypothetical protein
MDPEEHEGEGGSVMFSHWEVKPDMCELHRCENPYVEGTGDIDEGHWVCGRDDCEAMVA